MRPSTALLVLGSTMRLTRLVVTDDLGLWAIKGPAAHWAITTDDPSRRTRRVQLVSGLSCPFCVGTWIGFGVLAITSVTGRAPLLARGWRFVMAGLTLNEIAAHLGARLGDTADFGEEEEEQEAEPDNDGRITSIRR
jgi:hypothetical protein